MIHERFNAYLQAKGFTQRSISKLSCVNVATVNRFCSGNSIGSDSLVKILQVCDDLSLDFLFYGTGEMLRKFGGGGNVTNNYGAYAGADFQADDSVFVGGSKNVRFQMGGYFKDLVKALADKDSVIAQRDRTISERDLHIRELLSGRG